MQPMQPRPKAVPKLSVLAQASLDWAIAARDLRHVAATAAAYKRTPGAMADTVFRDRLRGYWGELFPSEQAALKRWLEVFDAE